MQFVKQNYPPDLERIAKRQFDQAAMRRRLLAPRQLEVARLIVLGLKNREIATQLGITVDGVKKHVTAVMNKAKVDRRTKIARWLEGLETYL